jgi:Arc/MetJ family transcription regulator
VYAGDVSRTNIDIDDEAVEWIMERFGLHTKRDAVNFALHQLYRKPLTPEEILELRGSGFFDLDLRDVRPGYEPFDE